ncbi:hypothetical protein QTV43_000122 [Vibrio vulnificus]|nr:hypothetical protein [Vibrio vulnificus]
MVMVLTNQIKVNESTGAIKGHSTRVERLAIAQINAGMAPSPLINMLTPVLPTSEASIFESVKGTKGVEVALLSLDEREALARDAIGKVSTIELDILKRQYEMEPSEKLGATISAYPDLVASFTDSIVKDLRSATTVGDAFRTSGIVFAFSFILCLISSIFSDRREKEKTNQEPVNL